ncbi:roadblock/LC7 domain-containing protein [Luedemannella flava]
MSIADRGIGMTAARMAQENRRLVERERLDIAPTSVLGLFVVGRLAKRHGLAVTLTATEGGGTTAHVTLPPALFQVGPGVGVERSAPRAMSAMAAVPVARGGARDFPAVTRKAGGDRTFVVSVPVGAGGFAWFGPPSRVTGGGTVRASAVADTPGAPVNGTSRPGLSRRVPGAQLPGAAGRSRGTAAAIPPQAPPVHDAAAVRDQLDAFQSTSPPAPPQTGPGPTGTGSRRLARRVPGANLAPGLRAGTAGAPAPAVGRPPVAGPGLRDPDAVRDAFDSTPPAWPWDRVTPPPSPPVPTASPTSGGEPRMTTPATGISVDAQNFNWLVNRFANDTSGVHAAIAVSSDGLLIAMSAGLDRENADRLGAISSAMLSLAIGVSESYPLGDPDRVVIELTQGYLLVTTISAGARSARWRRSRPASAPSRTRWRCSRTGPPRC